jgi:hypothetical protein
MAISSFEIAEPASNIPGTDSNDSDPASSSRASVLRRVMDAYADKDNWPDINGQGPDPKSHIASDPNTN